MRVIKFRAWDIFDKVMVYGNEHNGNDIWDGIRSSSVQLVNDRFEEYRYKWLQFTGLKDCNGKEIYEGDIVQTHNQNNVIRYQHGSFMVIGLHHDEHEQTYSGFYNFLIDATIPNEEGSRFDGITTTLRIIGNIYENPELVKNE